VVFLVLISLFLLMVISTKFVSVGSITAAFFYPLMLSAFFGAVPFFMLSTALLTAVLVIFLHRENVRRLIHGEEKKFGQKEPPKDGEEK
ncbi:MAG: glycerol-3-phosphate acyltransferase, partial [Clostridia bacterium]|nr:glycerol-3-phosphate acyltransferase [Clostridia bacterium]